MLAQNIWSMRTMGVWREQRQANILDGSAPFYGVYRCVDGRYMSVGAMEQNFYRDLVRDRPKPEQLPDRDDSTHWDELRLILPQAFESRPLLYWVDKFDGTHACVASVLICQKRSIILRR